MLLLLTVVTFLIIYMALGGICHYFTLVLSFWMQVCSGIFLTTKTKRVQNFIFHSLLPAVSILLEGSTGMDLLVSWRLPWKEMGFHMLWDSCLRRIAECFTSFSYLSSSGGSLGINSRNGLGCSGSWWRWGKGYQWHRYSSCSPPEPFPPLLWFTNGVTNRERQICFCTERKSWYLFHH
jgi:hypothetical protein